MSAAVDDSWGRLVVDLTVRAICLGGLAGGALWLAELPALHKLPLVGSLPRASRLPLLGALPTAAHLLGQKELPPVVEDDRPAAEAPHHRKRRHGGEENAQQAASQQTAKAGKDAPKAADPPVEKQAPKLPEPHLATAPPTPPEPVRQAAADAGVPADGRHSTGGVKYAARVVKGVPLHVVTVDLDDPSVVGTVGLAKGASHPNVAGDSAGDEAFEQLVSRAHAAVVINGTFFSKDAEKRVMGNMVRQGQTIKFSPWDHEGTTFWLGQGNRPGMATPKGGDPEPPLDKAWLAIGCGPRLVRDGKPWLMAGQEGFKDSHVLGVAGRTALGYDAQSLYLVSFDGAVALPQEAAVMQALGCTQAMNLDGGASRSLAVNGRVLVPAGRPLTNVLAFYDQKHPAPGAVAGAFRKFAPAAP